MTLPGGYELVERIGSGGMGDVWRAWDPRLERDVAIKFGASVDAQVEARLEREARALARLRHPSVVTVFDLGRDTHGVPFLVMELLRGEDLGRVLEREGALGARRAVEVILPVLEGLEIAHESGVVHRDIKPENIFLARRPGGRTESILVDFGIARTQALRTELTAGLLGTPGFMAPEQLRLGSTELGPPVDQWGVGVTLYLLSTGRLPFAGELVTDLFAKIEMAPLPYPRDGSLDSHLFRILARATRKKPADRYPSIAALATDLTAWRAALPPKGPSTSSAPVRSASVSSGSVSSASVPSASVPLESPEVAPSVDPARPETSEPSTLDEAIRRRFGDAT